MRRVPTSQQLDEPAVADLGARLAERLAVDPCDHSLRHTEAWARERGLDAQQLCRELAEAGGFCDCETFDNVVNDPEADDAPASARLLL